MSGHDFGDDEQPGYPGDYPPESVMARERAHRRAVAAALEASHRAAGRRAADWPSTYPMSVPGSPAVRRAQTLANARARAMLDAKPRPPGLWRRAVRWFRRHLW